MQDPANTGNEAKLRKALEASKQKVEAEKALNEVAFKEKEANLKEMIKEKRHNEKELEVMKAAMEDLNEERSNELREVLVSSEDVTIDGVIGKGGFGVVNLGTYTNRSKNTTTKVAIKQLLEINGESVGRFRFECFLMKNIRHPNIVEFIGVCWDDMLLACLLEFVSNGTLEDWLKRDRMADIDTRMTWKKHLLKTMTETALGVQYLHKSRFYDEEKKEWKDCIIHRDLKPDNMLLTDDWTLKLTDFGEARAADVNNTMTQVGTPIFVAPEIMKSGRYSSKVDSYR